MIKSLLVLTCVIAIVFCSACALPLFFEKPYGAFIEMQPGQVHMSVGEEVSFIVKRSNDSQRFNYRIEPKEAVPAFDLSNNDSRTVINIKYVAEQHTKRGKVRTAELILIWSCNADWNGYCKNRSTIFLD